MVEEVLDLKVRFINNDDADKAALLFMYSEVMRKKKTISRFMNRLRKGSGYSTLCLEFGGEIVGMLMYKHSVPNITIVLLHVDHPFRRNGGGTSMVKFLVDAYERSRIKTSISVLVPELNVQAQKFFRSLNFKGVDIKKDKFGPGNDGYGFVYNTEVSDE